MHFRTRPSLNEVIAGSFTVFVPSEEHGKLPQINGKIHFCGIRFYLCWEQVCGADYSSSDGPSDQVITAQIQQMKRYEGMSGTFTGHGYPLTLSPFSPSEESQLSLRSDPIQTVRQKYVEENEFKKSKTPKKY